MKMLKKTTALLLVVLMGISMLVACGGETNNEGTESQGESYVIRMGNTATYPSQPNVFMREFKEKIEAATDQITVELYEASAFGGPNEMIQGLQNGSMQVVCIPIGFYASVAPSSEVLDIPFLFDTTDEYFYVMNSSPSPTYDAYLEQQGLVAATWLLEGKRDIFSTSPITSYDELKGKNIRTYSSSISQAEIAALGANPLIMATGDVPLALQQKTIDGIQCGVTLATPAKYYDMAKYALTEAGTPVPIPAVVSKTFLDGMPEELQTLVLDTMRDVNYNSNYDYTVKYMEENYAELADNGVQITVASDEMLDEMKAATDSVKTDFFAKNPDIEAAYNEITAAIEKYRDGEELGLI